MPKKTTPKPKPKPEAPPFEYRASEGENPAVTLYIAGEYQQTVLTLTREPRPITARLIAQVLNQHVVAAFLEGFEAGKQAKDSANHQDTEEVAV